MHCFLAAAFGDEVPIMSIGVWGHMGFVVLAVEICSSSRFKSRRVLLLNDPHQQRAGGELQAGCSRFCTSTVTA